MTLVCGTDFSDQARGALEAAVLLAKRWSDVVVLVNVSAFLGWQSSLSNEGRVPLGPAAAKLDEALAEVKRDLESRLAAEARDFESSGVPIHTEFLEGAPDECLVASAEHQRARLVVLGALGRRTAPWRLGSTADRVAQRAKSPVLVVRHAQAFADWTAGRRPLRVLVGVDESASSAAAIAGLRSFVSSSPCGIVAAHVYWPPEQRAKRGAHGSMRIGAASAEIEQALRAELEPRLAQEGEKPEIELKLIGGLGRAADHLVQASIDLDSDLIVVGNHQRKGLDKIWHGSVSHGVLDRAATNVLCIPMPAP
jgi:nucleotide-binding universal stress UspA family protein